jgi:hypothetical protein
MARFFSWLRRWLLVIAPVVQNVKSCFELTLNRVCCLSDDAVTRARLQRASYVFNILASSSLIANRYRNGQQQPKAVGLSGYLLSLALIVQHVSDRQKQVASEIVCGFAAGILDPVVTCVISKWPILEFAIVIMNEFRTNLSAEEIIQRLGLGSAAVKKDDGSSVFHGARTDRFFNAVADTR